VTDDELAALPRNGKCPVCGSLQTTTRIEGGSQKGTERHTVTCNHCGHAVSWEQPEDSPDPLSHEVRLVG
jgi:transcription elongation factor Elf1